MQQITAIQTNTQETLLSASTLEQLFGNSHVHLYVARDRNGELYIYNYETKKCPEEDDTGMWCIDETLGKAIQLPEWMFPEVRWEDERPLLIINNELEM